MSQPEGELLLWMQEPELPPPPACGEQCCGMSGLPKALGTACTGLASHMNSQRLHSVQEVNHLQTQKFLMAFKLKFNFTFNQGLSNLA